MHTDVVHLIDYALKQEYNGEISKSCFEGEFYK